VSHALKKIFCVVIAVILLGLVSEKSAESARECFDIRSMDMEEEKDFVFVDVKYKCWLKRAEGAELRVYVLLKKRKDEKLASGSFSLGELEKRTYKENFMITASHAKEYGSPKNLRVEIWHKDRIRAAKTKPRAREKWWAKESVDIITRPDKDLLALLRGDDDGGGSHQAQSSQPAKKQSTKSKCKAPST